MAPCAATHMDSYFVQYHKRTRLTVLHPLWTNKNPTTHFKTTAEKPLPSLVPFRDYSEAVSTSFSAKYQFMQNIFMTENNQEDDGISF